MGRRNRRPIFDIFVICSNLIVGGGGGMEQEVFFKSFFQVLLLRTSGAG